MVQHQKAMSLKESKEVMKKFKGPPIINLSKSDCKKGRMQKVLKKFSKLISEMVGGVERLVSLPGDTCRKA